MRLRFEEDAARAHNGDGVNNEFLEVEAGGLKLGASDRAAAGATTLVPFTERGRSAVVMLLGAAGSRGILVDGYPPLSLSVLDPGTELVVGDDRYVLEASVAPPQVVLFSATDRPVRCVRCRRRLAVGDAVLACAHCGALRHEGPRADPIKPALECASYDPICNQCKGASVPVGEASDG